MVSKMIQRVSSVLACSAMFAVWGVAEPIGAIQEQASTPVSSPAAPPSPTPAVAPLTADELDSLVAPIALYPDALVAQILGAAASPDQIAIASYWLGQNKDLTGTALAQAVNGQTWDPSVKALTQFPSVLADLAGNLAWTSNLGQAFENQQSDVMAAVQTMRAKAQAAGTLQSTPQIKVVQQNPQTIVIQPADPDVVYVPQYNPTVVYGSPYVVPLYTPPVAVAAATVSFGAGVAIGAAFGGGGFGVVGVGGGFGWGFHAWSCNWGGGGGGGSVFYQHNTYIHNTTYINNRTNYNGYHPWGPGPHGNGPYGPHPYDRNGFVPNRDQPNGGRNGDHGLIGGNGGTQHMYDRNNDGGMERRTAYDPGANRRDMGGNDGRFNQQRSRMDGDGRAARMEGDRGRSSMRGGGDRHPEMHSHASRGGGGGRGRR